jgi:hypothetical protein
MKIRPASFRDLARIEQLYRENEEHGSQDLPIGGDSPVPQATLLRLWYAVEHTLSSLVPLTDSGDALLVAENDGEVVGFIQAQGVSGKPKVWQIINLSTTGNSSHFACARLLTALCNRGMESGITRLVVRVPADHTLTSAFIDNGFTQFATEQILFTDDGGDFPNARTAAVRPARRDDIGALYLLYLRTTPSQVASIEAPSQKLWQTTYAAGLASRVARDDVRHLVAERSGVYGWASIKEYAGPRPTAVTLMCEGQDSQAREEFIETVLGELPGGPATCVLRHYDGDLIRALQQRGFAIYGTQLLLVKDLAAKVKVRARKSREKPVFVAAGMARSVPHMPLSIVHSVAEKGIKRSSLK